MPNLVQTPNLNHIELLLKPYQTQIGAVYTGYKNHVIRMLTFALQLYPCNATQQQKLEIAACFHDIGLWTKNTVDYLPPSIAEAKQYLAQQGLNSWSDEITLMIANHHQITPDTHSQFPLVEVFRKADLTDFSLGLITNGISRKVIQQTKKQYPNAGFHAFLVKQGALWFLKHPLNPAPMIKWR